jgi:hypothetical protein
MQKIGDNKVVYNTIEELLDPLHTALVIWHVIHAFTKMVFFNHQNKQAFKGNRA